MPPRTPSTPPWKRAKPRGARTPTSLTPAQKAAAKMRAENAGRRYPNLIDNMWAARLPENPSAPPADDDL